MRQAKKAQVLVSVAAVLGYWPAGQQSESNRIFLVLLASYFSGRHELPAYATDLLASLSDDQRLQTEERIKSLLGLLALW
jgi:hypothetical protein